MNDANLIYGWLPERIHCRDHLKHRCGVVRSHEQLLIRLGRCCIETAADKRRCGIAGTPWANSHARPTPLQPCYQIVTKSPVCGGHSSKTLRKTGGRSRTGGLGFEAEFPRLVSRCSGVGNHCFSSDFYKNRTDRYCIGVEPTLPIFLPNSYQESREAWRFFLASRAISKKNLLASLAILCWPPHFAHVHSITLDRESSDRLVKDFRLPRILC